MNTVSTKFPLLLEMTLQLTEKRKKNPKSIKASSLQATLLITQHYSEKSIEALLICTSASHLDNGVSRGCGFDGSPAAFRLIVGSVVRTRLHLDAQLVLVELGWQRPVKRRQGVGPEGSWTVLAAVNADNGTEQVAHKTRVSKEICASFGYLL